MSHNGHAGNLERIRKALHEYEEPLMRYAQRMTGNAEHARDVVQETFFRLCRERPERVDNHLAEWLYTVCRNKALDVCRKERRMTRLSDATLAESPAAEPDPAHDAEQNEESTRVLDLVDRLPEKQREVILLKFQNGLSYRQIGEVTGQSVSNVGFLIHSGLKTIRQKVKQLT